MRLFVWALAVAGLSLANGQGQANPETVTINSDIVGCPLNLALVVDTSETTLDTVVKKNHIAFVHAMFIRVIEAWTGTGTVTNCTRQETSANPTKDCTNLALYQSRGRTSQDQITNPDEVWPWPQTSPGLTFGQYIQRVNTLPYDTSDTSHWLAQNIVFDEMIKNSAAYRAKFPHVLIAHYAADSCCTNKTAQLAAADAKYITNAIPRYAYSSAPNAFDQYEPLWRMGERGFELALIIPRDPNAKDERQAQVEKIMEDIFKNNCPIDGEWSSWTQSDCSATCGVGSLTERRVCNNPPPSQGGDECENESERTRDCDTKIPCPIDGGWTEWEDGKCSVTCGDGAIKSTRTCTNPSPAFGGKDCVGVDERTLECSLDPCPIDGGWTEWEDGQCSVTCGDGAIKSTRTCTNPSPAFGGKDCVGSDERTLECSLDPCPIDGGWNQWSPWSGCSATCGSATRQRSRRCDNPEPQYDGAECEGSSVEMEACQLPECEIPVGDYCRTCLERRNQNDYYADPNNCTRYYHCFFNGTEGYVGVLRPCPAGSRFSESLHNCVPRYDGLDGPVCLPDPCDNTTTMMKGYWQHPDDCGIFYRCSNYYSIRMCCPPFQSWDESLGDCIRDASCDHHNEECGVVESTAAPVPPVIIGGAICNDTVEKVLRRTHPDGDHQFQVITTVDGATVYTDMTCAPDTRFVLATCKCSNSTPWDPQFTVQPNRPCMLVVNFEPSADPTAPEIVDHSPNNFWVDNYGEFEVIAGPSAGANLVGLFGGNAHLEVPGAQGNDLGHRVSIELWFKPSCINQGNTQGIFSNGGETPVGSTTLPPTIEVFIEGGELKAGLRTTKENHLAAFTYAFDCEQITQFAMVYDGTLIEFYIDCELLFTVQMDNVNAPINWMQGCPLTIGTSYAHKYFDGIIDDVSICRDVWSKEAVCDRRDAYLLNHTPQN